jgi:hypothetical protein
VDDSIYYKHLRQPNSAEVEVKVGEELKVISRGRHQKLYSVFALSHNAATLRRKVIASYSYRSGLIEIITASHSYRSG